MLELLPLVPALPLLGFILLACGRRHFKETGAAIVGVGSVTLSAMIAGLVSYTWLSSGGEQPYVANLWTWIPVGDFQPKFALYLDGLAVTMLGVVTGVGSLIHLFASWYMRGDEGYSRFFSYMNLFVAMMLFLVLGDSLVVLYLGWEGVGLASYLLIGFWYLDPENGYAARKAFIITRVGDTLMAIGLFIIFHQLGSLQITEILSKVGVAAPQGAMWVDLAALLLLGGAVGKSAQLPLQTWLPDAMAGPTPVSALIHAATMVTAGVYLIARMHPLFELSPLAMQSVGAVGAVTLLMAGCIALTQRDIKRILAYSTMSQIGYMFLALGVGAWSAAVLHLMTHAFFKALLFLAAGSVILSMHHEQDIFKMGGLRRKLPLAFWSFVIGSAALTALPGTAGFISKDDILWRAYASGNMPLYYAGLLGAFMTAVYVGRLMFIVFFGESRHASAHDHDHHGHGHGDIVPGRGISHHLPLLVLIGLSIVGGWITQPLEFVFRSEVAPASVELQHQLEVLSVLVSLGGIVLAWILFHSLPKMTAAWVATPFLQFFKRWWGAAFGFDWLYDQIFVRPYVAVAVANQKDVADLAVAGVVNTVQGGHALLVRTQTGRLRMYAASVAGGAALLIAVILWL